jgi:hypothetical protein
MGLSTYTSDDQRELATRLDRSEVVTHGAQVTTQDLLMDLGQLAADGGSPIRSQDSHEVVKRVAEAVWNLESQERAALSSNGAKKSAAISLSPRQVA